MATTYRVVTESGRGLPTSVDADGYDTRAAAEAMADDCHDGAYSVVASHECGAVSLRRGVCLMPSGHNGNHRYSATDESKANRAAWNEVLSTEKS